MQKVKQQRKTKCNSSLLRRGVYPEHKRGTPRNDTFRWVVPLLCLCLLFNQPILAQEPGEQTQTDISKVKLQAVLTPPYVLGSGDQLVITDRTLRELFGLVERYDVIISSDGYVSIPLPDGTQENILAAGLTVDELSNEVREKFSKTLKNPLVFIQVLRYRPINVYIGGEVVKPGVYKIETATTSEKGGSTTSSLNTFGLSLTQAIQLAGGLKPRADVTSVIVTRGSSSEKKVIDVLKILQGEDTSLDINLHPGDAVYVPLANAIENQAQSYVPILGKIAYQEVPVSIIGEVKSAGSYIFPNDATLLDAIGMAGGTNEVGSLKKIYLSRFDNDGVYRTQKINVHDLIRKGVSLDQIALRPNDVINFEASAGKEIRHFMRDAANNTVPILAGTVAGGLSGFIVQDNFLDRLKRGNFGPTLPSGSASNAITIIGGNRTINESDK